MNNYYLHLYDAKTQRVILFYYIYTSFIVVKNKYYLKGNKGYHLFNLLYSCILCNLPILLLNYLYIKSSLQDVLLY